MQFLYRGLINRHN